MPGPFCHCQCKMCRVPGSGMHCYGHPTCGAPLPRQIIHPPTPDAFQVSRVLARLKAESGSHSPSVTQLEKVLPGLVEVDACFLANPYATAEVMRRFRSIPADSLERMISHYPSQSTVIAASLGPHLGLPAENLHIANGASEVIHALLADRTGPLLISVPTFSAYYEAARGPVVKHQLDQRDNFRVDLDVLEALVIRHSPETVVIINPNNPDGGLIPRGALVRFVERMRGKVGQIIVDESFSHFIGEAVPETLAPMIGEFPHLVVVNSLSKSYGVAGLRLGYAVMAAHRARALAASTLWNINAFAEWFCAQLADPYFQSAYENARRRYVRDTRSFFAELQKVPGVHMFPSSANFALLELDRPAHQVTAALLADHGIYVRDCADKQGLDGERCIRVATRTDAENRRILDGLRSVLNNSVLNNSVLNSPVLNNNVIPTQSATTPRTAVLSVVTATARPSYSQPA